MKIDMKIRCGLTEDGNIEAAIPHEKYNKAIRNVVIDSRTGNVIGGSEKYGGPYFRQLVIAARIHRRRPRGGELT